VRDFTDDIYLNTSIHKDLFVEGIGSELWCNLLVVVPKNKYN
jgi:hypothetical protein